ncbi:MAG: hypothetical protein CMH12_04115 [Maritimibacter sp.]|nr:hypothetical protein [Maritimibacter sp.]
MAFRGLGHVDAVRLQHRPGLSGERHTIATPGGDRRIESLAPGQLVLTHDRGPQPVRRLVSHTYRFPGGAHKMKPLRIPPARFGVNLPARELLLSPQHRIALPQTAPKRLVPARRLVDRFGLQQRHHCRIANYYNILMDRHEMIRANGLWVETLLLTRYSATRIGQGGRGAMRPARPIATA